MPIAKIDEERQLVFGWFSKVEQGGELVVDRQDDIIEVDEIEASAYDFVANARLAGENHTRLGVGYLVESMVFTKDKQAALGIDLGFVGWWGGFKITDAATWAGVKAGTLAMFSIGGTAVRQPQEESPNAA